MKEQRMARSLVGKGSLATKLVLTLVAADVYKRQNISSSNQTILLMEVRGR